MFSYIYQFSQVTFTLDRLEDTPVHVLSQLGSYDDKFLGLVDELDNKNEEMSEMTFTGKQLLAFHE